jgi:SAM-dependent methyltransferase
VTPEEQDAFDQHVRDGFKTPGEKSNLAHFMGKRKINLGCGAAPEPVWNGWLNVDMHRKTCAGLVFDMREPWPIKDEVFDTALAYLTLHMFFPGEELFHVMAEAWRILKPGGYFIGFVPMGHVSNPMHKSIWNERTPHLLVRSVYKESELATTGWDQGLPIKDWSLIGIDTTSLLLFVLRRVE